MGMIEIDMRGKKVKVDEIFYKNIKDLGLFIDKNFDGCCIVDGMEGSGKSEMGKQICMIHDKNFGERNPETNNKPFNAKDIFYTVEQFNYWLDNAPPGSAGLWDEFVLAGLSTEALSSIQNILIKKFTMIRKKRLLIILVIPYIFLLRKYFAIARTRFLVHTYCIGIKRGYFKFYDYKQKLWIYNYGHKTWLYNDKVRPSFEGRFVAWTDALIDEEEVQRKKDEAIASMEEEKITLTKRQIEEISLIKSPVKSSDDHQSYKVWNNLIKKCQKVHEMNL